MKVKAIFIFLSLVLLMPCFGQENEEKSWISDLNISGLKMRNIGPAFTSGRIADIAVHPDNDNVWYVAVGSGGVWKTENSGTTWKPIFDNQSVYSIGCITIDPNNPHTIWVGTGENVGGRHVGYGDGIYKSTDDGASWKKMGLEKSEHISKIIVHPGDSEVVYVAVQGPLWNKGGERGFYKSVDGGENWTRTLGDDEWVGVTDIVQDPESPMTLYAATWQRHRTVAAYMGGGPGSGIHRSDDGGETWKALKKGIPGSNLGKIGIAISPFDTDVLYAAIELDRTKGGVYMSTNRGESWRKQSDAVSGATGPHYYQELYASPHFEGTLYLMDNRIQVSTDHGKTFTRMNERSRHGDNHSINFRMDDPNYLLVGTDGGIYETFDLTKTWKFIDNLPITQYYKVAVDDSEPFYNIFGGTQDNGSHGGPSRTDNVHGIRNADWYKTLGADGHQSATEPGNPNITYAETQQGGLHRIDRITGEQVYIQPQAKPGEKFERFNWDAPILVSPHNPKRLYFASYRVWKSENRGDSWEAISEDLTRDEERVALPIMGRVQSWDNPWDVNAMSNYNTITSLSESPLQEGLLYAGTDDGIVQISETDGSEWMKVDLSELEGMPNRLFVNDIRADLHDPNTVYMCADNHKEGDFKPYILKSSDKGKTWKMIAGDLPDNLLIWRIVQDHEKPELLFAASEFGIYFTVNGGENWKKIKAGVPTISFRDITIQRRENDLVGASFGRGFYILDDISPLRELNEETVEQEGVLFPVKDAYWYNPKSIISSQGSDHYVAENPPHGAIFTYYIKENYPTIASERMKNEKALNKEGKDIPFPGWDKLEEERREEKPQLIFTIKDESGDIVNMIKQSPKQGVNRITWDMRHQSKGLINPGQQGGGWRSQGFMAMPGNYTVSMSIRMNGELKHLGEEQTFSLIPLRNGALEGKSIEEIVAFRKDFEQFQQEMGVCANDLNRAGDRIKAMYTALDRVDKDYDELSKKIFAMKQQHEDLDIKLNGDKVKDEIGERYPATPRGAMFLGYRALSTTYGPTENHISVVENAKTGMKSIMEEVKMMHKELDALEQEFTEAGAPMIYGGN